MKKIAVFLAVAVLSLMIFVSSPTPSQAQKVGSQKSEQDREPVYCTRRCGRGEKENIQSLPISPLKWPPTTRENQICLPARH